MIKKIFFLVLGVWSCSTHASKNVPEDLEIPPFKIIEYFDPYPVILFSDDTFLVTMRVSQLKIFSINGTYFNYDEIFNNKERPLHWHAHKQKDRSGDLLDIKAKKYLEPIDYKPLNDR